MITKIDKSEMPIWYFSKGKHPHEETKAMFALEIGDAIKMDCHYVHEQNALCGGARKLRQAAYIERKKPGTTKPNLQVVTRCKDGFIFALRLS